MAKPIQTVPVAKYVVLRYRIIALVFVLLLGVLILRELEHARLRAEAQRVMTASEAQFTSLSEAARCLAKVQEAMVAQTVHLMAIQTSTDDAERLQGLREFEASQRRLDAAAVALKNALASWERGSK